MKHHAGQCRQVLPCLFGFEVILWGRKDGFPGGGANRSNLNTTILIYGENDNPLTEGGTGIRLVPITTNGVLSGNNSLTYSIKQPLVFIYNVATLGDWYTNSQSSQNNILWGDGDAKSAYDPCPKGWKVPTHGTWSDFSISNTSTSGSGTNIINGRLYCHITWYPAGGSRHGNTGEILVVGNNGYYWSSTNNASNAHGMDFDLSNIHINGIYYRASGIPVRCIQE